MGNLRSVEKALRKVGADVNVTDAPGGMRDARGQMHGLDI